MRLTPARHQATCPVIMPAMRLSPRRCRRYISGRHGRAPDRSPRGRAATAALCSRAVRCDLKPIVAHRRAARVAARARAAAAPNWKVIPGTCKRTDFMHSSSVADVLRGDAETGRKLHNSLGKCHLVFVARQHCMPDTDESAAPRIREVRFARRHRFPSIYVSRGYRQIAG